MFGIKAGAYRTVSYILENFSRATFASQIVCLYRQPFRNYFALKMEILENYSKIQHIWPFGGKLLGATAMYYTLLESSFHG